MPNRPAPSVRTACRVREQDFASIFTIQTRARVRDRKTAKAARRAWFCFSFFFAQIRAFLDEVRSVIFIYSTPRSVLPFCLLCSARSRLYFLPSNVKLSISSNSSAGQILRTWFIQDWQSISITREKKENVTMHLTVIYFFFLFT